MSMVCVKKRLHTINICVFNHYHLISIVHERTVLLIRSLLHPNQYTQSCSWLPNSQHIRKIWNARARRSHTHTRIRVCMPIFALVIRFLFAEFFFIFTFFFSLSTLRLNSIFLWCAHLAVFIHLLIGYNLSAFLYFGHSNCCHFFKDQINRCLDKPQINQHDRLELIENLCFRLLLKWYTVRRRTHDEMREYINKATFFVV